jgi:hypothetical protein
MGPIRILTQLNPRWRLTNNFGLDISKDKGVSSVQQKQLKLMNWGLCSKRNIINPKNHNCQAYSYVHRRLSDIIELIQAYQEGIRFLEVDCSREFLNTWHLKKAINQNWR